MSEVKEMQCNFGGFISISTVDWPGYASAIVFLRGCPNTCKDCHNRHLLKETKTVPLVDVLDVIKTASTLVSTLIVSGGEPTKHQDELEQILKYAKQLGLRTRVQTSGAYPFAICEIIDQRLVDSIALDIKTELENYNEIFPKSIRPANIGGSLDFCEKAQSDGRLKDFEVVHTIFPYNGYEERLTKISNSVAVGTRFVLQQGSPRDRNIEPLTRDQLFKLATTCVRQTNVKIRTKECGEETIW